MSSSLHSVFGHFQNLNLLVLLEDLRAGRVARQAWFTGSMLCPVAHGMPEGDQVEILRALGQTDELPVGCKFAARHLSADPYDVWQFVSAWDEDWFSTDSLLQLLEQMWEERLADADAVQVLLQETRHAQECTPTGDESEALHSSMSVR